MFARLRTPDHLAPLLAVAGVLMLGTGLAGPAAAEPAGDPPGRNGSVKIEYVGDEDETPENNPMQPCTLNVEWYGLDQGDIDSQVSFELKAPTRDSELSVDGPLEVPVGEDPAGGGRDLDAAVTYTFAIEGEPGPQGHHLRVAVHTPGGKGLERKTKVFWVESCAAPSVKPEAPTDPTPSITEATPTEAADSSSQAVAAAHVETAMEAPQRGDDVPHAVDAGIEQAAVDTPGGGAPVGLALLGALIAAAGALLAASGRRRGAHRS